MKVVDKICSCQPNVSLTNKSWKYMYIDNWDGDKVYPATDMLYLPVVVVVVGSVVVVNGVVVVDVDVVDSD